MPRDRSIVKKLKLSLKNSMLLSVALLLVGSKCSGDSLTALSYCHSVRGQCAMEKIVTPHLAVLQKMDWSAYRL
jgi:hypothetical protein